MYETTLFKSLLEILMLFYMDVLWLTGNVTNQIVKTCPAVIAITVDHRMEYLLPACICVMMMCLITNQGVQCGCAFDVYNSRVYKNMSVLKTHRQTSGPKCKYLCQEDIRCIGANLLLVRGQGFLCEILYESYSDRADIVQKVDAMVFIKKGMYFMI